MKLLRFIFSLILLFGCSDPNPEKPEIVAPAALGTVLDVNMVEPIVTKITSTNAPKFFRPPAPRVIETQSLNGFGAPSITNYTIADGLPTSILDAPFFDNSGNLWLGGFSGLVKFDGANFTSFDGNNGMAGFLVDDIFIDSDNLIWLSTEEGISTYDLQGFTNFQIGVDYQSNGKFFIDRTGNKWVISSQGLFHLTDGKFSKVYLGPELSNEKIQGIAEDKEGNIIISTDSGLFSVSKGFSVLPYSIPNGKVAKGSFLYSDREGNLWFSQGDFISTYDGNRVKIIAPKSAELKNPIFHQDDTGKIWIGWLDTYAIMSCYDGEKIRTFELWEKDSRYYLTGITNDAYGNIWVTSSGGLAKLSFDFPSEFEGYPDYDFLRSIVKSSTGELWGTDNSSLIKFEENRLKFYDRGIHFPSNKMSGIFADRNGNIWLSAQSDNNPDYKLFRFDGETISIYGEAQGIKSEYIGEKYQDSKGRYWFAANDGLYLLEGDQITFYENDHGLPEYDFTCLLEDSRGVLWFGSSGEGLFRFDENTLINYKKKDGLLDGFIHSIAEGPYGDIWIGMDRGVNKFDGKTFKTFSKSSGLNQDVITIVSDTLNRKLWFGTLNGLGVIPFEQIPEENIKLKTYNYRSGFNFSFINPHGLVVDDDGNIYLAGSNDVKISVPKFEDMIIQKPSITGLRIDSNPISWKVLSSSSNLADSLLIRNEMITKLGRILSPLELAEYQKSYRRLKFDSLRRSDFLPANLLLPYGIKSIIFDFSPSSPSFGKGTLYQYKLLGFEENWSQASEIAFASFGNLREGKYTLLVKVIKPFGESQETRFTFTVLPPWYRTWWAFIGFFVLAIVVIKVFEVYRSRMLKRKNRILEAIIARRTDALHKSLEELKATQSQLVQSEKMASMGELASGIAHEIQNPLNFVNNFTEVSDEMVNEAIDEQNKSPEIRDEKVIKGLLDEVKNNLQIIRKHGLQADAIVKNMMAHSKQGQAKRELINLNSLTNGFLKMSYHSFLSKYKNVDQEDVILEICTDENLPQVNVIPQEIGKILLNLLNNAFYAVRERMMKERGIPRLYQPCVKVSTFLDSDASGNSITCVSIQDNGIGIPDSIRGKVFLPFFTTKPTGQGSGLGLSLSYDIAIAHGGKIALKSEENEGSIFTLCLPVNEEKSIKEDGIENPTVKKAANYEKT